MNFLFGAFGPIGALVDPRSQQAASVTTERLAFRWHFHVRSRSRDTLYQRTFGTIARMNVRRVVLPSFEGRLLAIEPKLALLLVWTVAFEAMRLKDRLDILLEIDGAFRSRRQVRFFCCVYLWDQHDERQKRCQKL